MNMPTRRFGRTELEMPVLTLGGMRFQDGWKDKSIDEVDPDSQRNLEALLHSAIERGMNHIETARFYGCSERQLGHVLPSIQRDKLIVQTKVPPCESAADFRRDVLDSMQRLQLDYVDLLSIHGVNDETLLQWSLREGGCLEAARQLQAEGKVGHVGFSTHAPCEIILQAIESEVAGGFDYVNLHWYAIFQQNWPAIEAATKRDMGVLIISPNDKGGHLQEPAPVWTEACAPYHPMQVNGWFCLSHPEIHTLSIGASCEQDLEVHLEMAQQLARSKELCKKPLQRLADLMQRKTGTPNPECWSNLLPAKGETGLNLRVMLWLWHLSKGWGMDKYVEKRLNLLGEGGHWFPGASGSELAKLSSQEILSDLAPLGDQAQLALERLHEVWNKHAGSCQKRLSQS